MGIGMGAHAHSENWGSHNLLAKTKALGYNGKRQETGVDILLRDAQ